MPIKTQSDLPAKEILEKENIFVMDENRATHQDIRAINIAILNLMPLKEDTELQLLRSLSNTPLQVEQDTCHVYLTSLLGCAGRALLSLRFEEISASGEKIRCV